jgi:hypothetical protein
VEHLPGCSDCDNVFPEVFHLGHCQEQHPICLLHILPIYLQCRCCWGCASGVSTKVLVLVVKHGCWCWHAAESQIQASSMRRSANLALRLLQGQQAGLLQQGGAVRLLHNVSIRSTLKLANLTSLASNSPAGCIAPAGSSVCSPGALMEGCL